MGKNFKGVNAKVVIKMPEKGLDFIRGGGEDRGRKLKLRKN